MTTVFLFQFLHLVPHALLLTMTSGTMWNRSGNNQHLCFIPTIRRKAFTVSPLGMIFIEDFLMALFSSKLRKLPSIPSLLKVLSKIVKNVAVYQMLLHLLKYDFSPFVSMWQITLTFFFLRFYLFIWQRGNERAQAREGQRKREKQNPCWAGSPMWDSIPGPWDHDLSWRLTWLSHLGACRMLLS